MASSESMRRKLSSTTETFFTKILFPVVWVILFCPALLAGLFGSSLILRDRFLILAGLMAGTWVVFRVCIRLKVVSIDDHNLFVRDYPNEISLPLEDIANVTENRWIRVVTIHLKSSCKFGDKILFSPKPKLFLFFRSHPVVFELKALASKASSS